MTSSSRENLTLWYAKNKGADKPSHSRSLVSAFAYLFLISMISEVVTCIIDGLEHLIRQVFSYQSGQFYDFVCLVSDAARSVNRKVIDKSH